MENGREKKSSWQSPELSSTLLIWLLPPLLLVAAVAVVMSPKASIYTFTSRDRDEYLRSKGGLNETVSRNPSQMHFDEVFHKQPLAKNEERNPGVTTMPKSQKRQNYLQILEANLAQARAAIKQSKQVNQTKKQEYIPNGPMYWNPSAFHRSYSEMEKRFKVFIYNEGDPPLFHSGPCKLTYAIEGLFMHALEVSPFRTYDPNEAHVFFLPFSITRFTQYIFVQNDWSPMKNAAIDYVNAMATKYPYWNRTSGADHFIIACHDYGPEISFAIPNLYNNSIRAFCNANTSERFDPARDVSIPEILLPAGTMDGMLGGPSPSQRPVLVFYAGGVHGPIRPILLEYWENKDEDVQIYKYLPKNMSYYGMMRKSKYCICPSGYEVASPRMVEALYMGCVPVLIKDGYVIPFSDVLNWETFAVIIPPKDIPNLKKILQSIPRARYVMMVKRGLKMRRHFEVNTPPKPYDVFHMILHSIWLRRLNIRLRGSNGQ